MKKSTTHFALMSDLSYSAAMQRYGNLKELAEIRQNFDNFAYNAMLRYIGTGDVTHVVRVLIAAKEIGRFRLFRAIFKRLIAHAWHAGPNSLPDRKSKANKKKMRGLVVNGAARFLVEFQDAETKRNAKNEPTKNEPTKNEPTKNEPTKNEPAPWDLNSAVATFVEEVESHNGSLAQVLEALMKIQNEREKIELPAAA